MNAPPNFWECACGAYNNPCLTACSCGRERAVAAPSAFEPCDDEGKLHEEIIKKLKALNWPYCHSRMDVPSTISWGNVWGVTDFIIAAPKGVTLWVEVKSKTGKMEPDQTGFGMALLKQCHKWYVVRSMDEFQAVLERQNL